MAFHSIKRDSTVPNMSACVSDVSQRCLADTALHDSIQAVIHTEGIYKEHILLRPQQGMFVSVMLANKQSTPTWGSFRPVVLKLGSLDLRGVRKLVLVGPQNKKANLFYFFFTSTVHKCLITK